MFCSMYLRGIETRWSYEEWNVDDYLEETEQGLDMFSQRVQLLGVAKYMTLYENIFVMTQWYVLSNCKEIASYL